MSLDREFWNERYREQNTGWDIGYPSTPIKSFFEGLKTKDKKILIPGAGNAYEAQFLYSIGFKNTFIVDFAELAIRNFKERIPQFPLDQIECINFFDHKGQYDIIVEQTFFCAIDKTLRKDYVSKCHELLNPSGVIVGLLFIVEFGKDEPPYGGTIEEYHDLFSKYFNIHKLEPCYNSIQARMGSELFIHFKKKSEIEMSSFKLLDLIFSNKFY